ncbi:MAG: hypothetical protein J5803_05665, partial [Desulfovibrio sp.]|nr:hypothetical protein [Desulfovibrio sp.]
PKDSHFDFACENDCTLHGALGVSFNHWLFSFLLDAVPIPPSWTVSLAERVSCVFQDKKPKTLKDALFLLANRLFLALPFPHLKGISISQSLRFSLALSHQSEGDDHSQPVATASDYEALNELALPCDPYPLFQMALPRSLKNLMHPKTIKKTKKPHSRCASIKAYEDASYRQRLALFRAKGNRLFFVQHGGNYGQIRKACLTAMVEYTQHAFLSWGWKQHDTDTDCVYPLPYPQLARIRNAWHKKSETLLFVGTEMPLFGYRLDAHPSPLQIVAYREAKRRFLTHLPDNLRNKLSYRPYFSVPSCLRDAEWLRRFFPMLSLCTGPLTEHMLGCSLLILDHHGTTLLEAMAANVPTVLFWQKDHWPLTTDCEAMLARFEKVGIFHETPEQAAAHIKAIWPHTLDWWQKNEVQAARMAFCHDYARIQKENEDRLWIECLQKL